MLPHSVTASRRLFLYPSFVVLDFASFSVILTMSNRLAQLFGLLKTLDIEGVHLYTLFREIGHTLGTTAVRYEEWPLLRPNCDC